MHVVGIWEAKGSRVVFLQFCFSVPWTGYRYFRNTAMRTGNCMLLLHWEQHTNFWCFMWINKQHQICYLLEGTFWKGNMTLFSSGRQPKALDTRSAPQKLVLLWVPKLFRTSLLCVLPSTVAYPTMWRPPKKAREPIPVFLPSHWPPQLREHLA